MKGWVKLTPRPQEKLPSKSSALLGLKDSSDEYNEFLGYT